MEGKCPMCGSPVINDFSGDTPYPDFCRVCADRIMADNKKKRPELARKIEKKIKRKKW